MKRIASALLLPLFLCACAANIDDRSDQSAGTLQIDIFEDTLSELDCRGITNKALHNSFKALDISVLNLNFSRSSFWLRLRTPPGRGELFIVFQENLLDYAGYCGPGFKSQEAGTTVAFREWPLKLRYPAFKIRTGPGVHYFRIRSNFILNFPVRIFNFARYIDFVQSRQITQGALICLALLVAAVYLVLYFIGRRIPNLYFALMIISTTATFYIVYGDALLYFWSNSPRMQSAAAGISTMIGGMIAALLSRHLLASWQLPRLDAGIMAFVPFQMLGLLLAPFPIVERGFLFIMYSSPFVALSLIVPAAVIQLNRGQLPARFYLLGGLIFLVALVLNVATYQGWVAYNSFLRFAPMYAAPLAFLCFAFGVYKQIDDQNRETKRLQRINAHLNQQLQSQAESAPARGAGQTQLTGVDIQAKKSLVLNAMRTDRLYETEDLRLETLASHVDLRPHQLSELLNKELMVSFTDFVRSFRIDAARSLLDDPANTNSILDIGLAVGFGSKSAFNRSFTSLTGLTPKQYRSRNVDAKAKTNTENE